MLLKMFQVPVQAASICCLLVQIASIYLFSSPRNSFCEAPLKTIDTFLFCFKNIFSLLLYISSAMKNVPSSNSSSFNLQSSGPNRMYLSFLVTEELGNI